jgi:hypothetical protein
MEMMSDRQCEHHCRGQDSSRFVSKDVTKTGDTRRRWEIVSTSFFPRNQLSTFVVDSSKVGVPTNQQYKNITELGRGTLE